MIVIALSEKITTTDGNRECVVFIAGVGVVFLVFDC